MENKTWKVFFACALGAFVGALVALQINHNFWWVGLVAGFSVGYVTYDFEKVVTAVSIAWRSTRPSSPNLAGLLKSTIIGLGSGITIGIGLVTTIFAVIRIEYGYSQSLLRGVQWVVAVAVLSLGQIYREYCFPELGDEWEFFSEDKLRAHFETFIGDYAKIANPFRVYLWVIPRQVLRGGRWLARRAIETVERLMIFLRHFLWIVFTQIHSELRLLCGVDAAIGAAVGFYFGNALIGALVGGLWGVLNFELVSIRFLKLVPETQSLFRR